MRGGDVNFDFLGLSQRIGTAYALSQNMSRHPEWNHPARKINCTTDRKNTQSWQDDTKIANVNLESCWMKGLRSALAVLRTSQVFADHQLNYNMIIENEKGVDMLR